VSPAEERAALARLAGYMALVWVACAAVFFAWSTARSPAFDVRSPAGWVRGISVGAPAQRARALVALSESTMLARVPCRVLADRLRDSAVVREAAVFTLISVVRGGRCGDVVLQVLEGSSDQHARAAAAQVLGGAGPAVRSTAVEPLLLTLDRDAPNRAVAANALAAVGDTSERVRRALMRAFGSGDPNVRAAVLDALTDLRAPAPQLRLLAERGLGDLDAAVRASAVSAIEALARLEGRR
jgi:hypothetical protein